MGTFLLGLVAAVIGVSGTLLATIGTHVFTQRRDKGQARAEAAAEFLARAQGLRTEYQMLDLALDIEGVEKLVQDETDNGTSKDRGELAKHLFERGLDAWSAYRNAEANFTANSESDVKDGADRLHEALDKWVDYVDARYLGINLDQIEGPYTSASQIQTPTERYQGFRRELALFENQVRRMQGLTEIATPRRFPNPSAPATDRSHAEG